MSVIEVYCQCGNKLAKYDKRKKGFLVKMYLDQISEDPNDIFLDKKFNLDDEIFCPKCNKRIATIKMIHGRLSAKVNHGTVKKITT
ncbi:MAG TPA: hypothetical protein P5052_04415 [Candidatus Paceibacterota bacterium]|nr:hypothetical protein [Candidatus Paceibacterota bacterium]